VRAVGCSQKPYPSSCPTVALTACVAPWILRAGKEKLVQFLSNCEGQNVQGARFRVLWVQVFGECKGGVYDMVKAVDRGMVIRELRLEEKSGGKSGHYRRDKGVAVRKKVK
jgi:hypothetical protein